jgi:hypothetical protein
MHTGGRSRGSRKERKTRARDAKQEIRDPEIGDPEIERETPKEKRNGIVGGRHGCMSFLVQSNYGHATCVATARATGQQRKMP